MGHGAKQSAERFAGQLVGGMDLDQAAWRGFLVEHSGPAVVQFAKGKLPSGKPGFPP